MAELNITVASPGGDETLAVEVTDLVIAGWTGRDTAAMEHHIAELEAIGIARPAATPMFYRVSASLLSTSPVIDVVGGDSCGEVECVLVAHRGRLLVGLGSDHTDRKVEAYGVTVSKQICAKPVSATFWLFDDVADHWDALATESHAMVGGARVLYQQGPMSALLHPRDLIRKYTGTDSLEDGTAMFCGTHPAIGGIKIGTAFECRLVDPVLTRELDLGYGIRTLPIVG